MERQWHQERRVRSELEQQLQLDRRDMVTSEPAAASQHQRHDREAAAVALLRYEVLQRHVTCSICACSGVENLHELIAWNGQRLHAARAA